MIGFILGVLVGAAGYWGYRFWKGGDDTSWDQSFSSSGSGGSSYGGSQPSYSPESVGSGSSAGGSQPPSSH